MKLLFCIIFALCSSVFAGSLEQIRSAGVVKIGVRDGRPPFSDEKSGNFEGFEINLADAIAKSIFGDKRGRVEFVPLNASDRISALQNDKVDLAVATITITQDRKRQIDFSYPYFSMSLGVLTRKSDGIKSIDDLSNKKVLVEGSGTTAENFLYKNKIRNLIHCSITTECYDMLKQGKADAYVNDNLIVLAYSIIDDNLEVAIQNLGNPEFLGIGVRKGNTELLDLINKELVTLSKQGFFERSYDETFKPFYQGAADKKYFLLDGLYAIF